MSKPVVLLTFVEEEDLYYVTEESKKVWNFVNDHSEIDAKKTTNGKKIDIVNNIMDNYKNMLLFHFGGHTTGDSIILEGARAFGRKPFINIIFPRGLNNSVQIIFLNGCMSNGHARGLMQRGCKIVIASNIAIDDEESSLISTFFYRMFFREGASISASFEAATAVIENEDRAPNVFRLDPIEDPRDTEDDGWSLYVNSNFPEVLNWTLQDFINDHNGSTTTTTTTTTTPPPTTTQAPRALDFNSMPLEQLVAEDHLKPALEHLKDSVDRYERNNIFNLMGRLARLERDRANGVLTDSSYNVSRAQIRAAVMYYINK